MGVIVTVHMLNECVQAIVVMLGVAVVLVALLHFLCLGPVELVRYEVATCCIQDALCWEGFMNWVVQVYLGVALSEHISDAGVKSNKECHVEIIQGDLALLVEWGGDIKEVPVIFYDISFVANSVLS